MAQKVIELGLEPSVVESTIFEKMNRTGSGYSCIEALVEDCLCHSPTSERTEERGSYMSYMMVWPLVKQIESFLLYRKRLGQTGLMCANCLPFLQLRTHWRNCGSCRGKNSAKYVWTEIAVSSSYRALTWPPARGAPSRSPSVRFAVEL